MPTMTADIAEPVAEREEFDAPEIPGAPTAPPGDFERAQPLPAEHRLEPLAAGEPATRRWAFTTAAVLIAVGFFVFTHAYWAPAHPGIDQNGYLVGGRIFAKTLSTGYLPASPFHYVGGMWVQTEDGWVYPKYPLGIPILTAMCFWIGGEANGPILTYYVSPLCATAAVLGMFFLTRQIAGSFAAVMAQILLASNAVMLQMTNNPWSHAPAIGFVIWGICCLMWWWRYDGLWRAALAGFLLGFAVLIRYTEALLLIPMAVVCLTKLRWTNWRSWLRCATPLFAWLVPVAYLLAFNKLAMGTWTGYDTTNESTGFDATKLADKWRGTLDQLYDVGAYFILPLGLLGMLLLFRFSWKIGLFLLTWFVPGVILYSAYYWGGGNMPRMGYLRFFLTLLPPLFVAACWVMTLVPSTSPAKAGPTDGPLWSRLARALAVPVAVGLIVGVTAALSVADNISELERQFATQANLADTTNVVKLHTRNTPTSDVILFCDGAGGIMNTVNHMQFATGFEMYLASAFSQTNQPWMRRRGNDPDQPDPLQPRRRDYLREQYAKYSDAELVAEQNKVVSQALSKGKRVLVLVPESQAGAFTRRYVKDDAPFRADILATWKEPVAIPEQADRNDRRPDRGGPPGGPPGGPGAAPPPDRRARANAFLGGVNPARPMQLLELKRK